jgi:hypothetical protein
VAPDGSGRGRKEHLEGGGGETRCVLPAGQADSKSREAERREGFDTRQRGSASSESDFVESAAAGIELISEGL